MKEKILRKVFLGFIHLHILFHASKEPIYGTWMKEELESHGYTISYGTLYPILHNLEKSGLLESEEQIIDGKVRKYYRATKDGIEVCELGKERAKELFCEVSE